MGYKDVPVSVPKLTIKNAPSDPVFLVDESLFTKEEIAKMKKAHKAFIDNAKSEGLGGNKDVWYNSECSIIINIVIFNI